MLKMIMNQGEAVIEASGDMFTLLSDLSNGAAQTIVHLAELTDAPTAELLELLNDGITHIIELIEDNNRDHGKEVKSNATKAHQELR